MDTFETPAYRRARKAYVTQCAMEYFVSLLVTDVFLAKLLSNIGISDGMVGIISSFITLAFVFQFLTIFIVKINVSAKKLVMLVDTISIFFFMLLYLTPFLPLGKTGKTIFLMVCILLAYVSKYLVMNICFAWANSFVSPHKRARFSANKEMVSLFSGMIFTAVVGFVIDRFETKNNLSGSFLFIAVAILILNICNFIAYAMIGKDQPKEKKERVLLSQVFQKTLGNRKFRSIIILTVLWDMARYFSIGFMGVFKNKELMMSVFLVQIINIAANLIRLFISKPMGKYADKHSFSKGFKLGLCLAAAGFFVNIFTSGATWFLIIIFTILYNCAFAGTNQNSFNMVYSYVDSCYITEAMAIKNCIGGLFGFGASVLGSKILDAVQNHGNLLFGVPVYGQQILSGISFGITVVAIIFVGKVVEKQKIMIQ